MKERVFDPGGARPLRSEAKELHLIFFADIRPTDKSLRGERVGKRPAATGR